MDVKIIAIDVDGTLIDDKHNISERNSAAVRAAQAAGIKVVLATGRSRRSCLKFLDTLSIDAPSIFINGLNIAAADGATLHNRFLDLTVTDRFLAFLAQRPLPYIAYTADGIATPKRSYWTDLIIDYNEPAPTEVADIRQCAIYKLIALVPPEEAQALSSELSIWMGNGAEVLVTNPEMVEIMPAGTTKGVGLSWLSEQLNVPMAQIMAIGNGENDVTMVVSAGIGVAMGNSAQVLLDSADLIVADNNHSGVAEAIGRTLTDLNI